MIYPMYLTIDLEAETYAPQKLAIDDVDGAGP